MHLHRLVINHPQSTGLLHHELQRLHQPDGLFVTAEAECMADGFCIHYIPFVVNVETDSDGALQLLRKRLGWVAEVVADVLLQRLRAALVPGLLDEMLVFGWLVHRRWI